MRLRQSPKPTLCWRNFNPHFVTQEVPVLKGQDRQAEPVLSTVVASIRDLKVVNPRLEVVVLTQFDVHTGPKEVCGGNADEVFLAVDGRWWGRYSPILQFDNLAIGVRKPKTHTRPAPLYRPI